MQKLIETVRLLLADHKGLLAMDESNGTCNKRFAAAGIPQTEEARRAYRELIITTPGLGECVSGVILYDETIRQSRADGDAVRQGPRRGRHRARHQGRYRRQGSRGTSGREDHRGARRPARASPGLFQDGRAVRQMARGDRHRRGPSEPRLHRRQRARAGALRRALPGGRPRADRRARSADGRRPYDGALRGGDRSRVARRVRSARRSRRRARGDDPQTQHGSARIGLSEQPTAAGGRRSDGSACCGASFPPRFPASPSSPADRAANSPPRG